MCRAPCGARGLKSHLWRRELQHRRSRAPCGARGLKSRSTVSSHLTLWSRPMRGAWIEIACLSGYEEAHMSRPMRGAWIEIHLLAHWMGILYSRAPCGARGLKFPASFPGADMMSSRPMRGAWIEIPPHLLYIAWNVKSRPMRGAWIEIPISGRAPRRRRSRPMRGAWIEIGVSADTAKAEKGRAPCGARGLKCNWSHTSAQPLLSRPMRGAWIEIPGAAA